MITFDAEGGEPASQTLMVAPGAPLGEVPTAAKTGCGFGGWRSGGGVCCGGIYAEAGHP
jgi:hypothetical protein